MSYSTNGNYNYRTQQKKDTKKSILAPKTNAVNNHIQDKVPSSKLFNPKHHHHKTYPVSDVLMAF